PIISEEQWNKVQQSRKNNLPTTMNYELCNPFSRIVKCGKCGRTIVRRTTSTTPLKYRLSCPNRECNLRSIFLAPFEELVVTEMTEWLKQYTIQVDNGDVIDNRYTDLLTTTEKQLSDARQQQDKICDLLEKGVYTIEMFTKRNEKLQEDIHTLTNTTNNLLEEIKKQDVDTIILGCTHYPLLKQVIGEIMGESVTHIDSGAAGADCALELLKEKNMLCEKNVKGGYRYFVSDATEDFVKLGSMFLSCPIDETVHKVDIEKY
ncbi:MAG: aspartate/glutamate racemase family protein, partial [Clostridia bacterium]|nr:aspartate/glutamate racemase family protein [Clostridia bacterium]